VRYSLRYNVRTWSLSIPACLDPTATLLQTVVLPQKAPFDRDQTHIYSLRPRVAQPAERPAACHMRRTICRRAMTSAPRHGAVSTNQAFPVQVKLALPLCRKPWNLQSLWRSTTPKPCQCRDAPSAFLCSVACPDCIGSVQPPSKTVYPLPVQRLLVAQISDRVFWLAAHHVHCRSHKLQGNASTPREGLSNHGFSHG
jgi:hypothetical protein